MNATLYLILAPGEELQDKLELLTKMDDLSHEERRISFFNSPEAAQKQKDEILDRKAWSVKVAQGAESRNLARKNAEEAKTIQIIPISLSAQAQN